MTPARSTCPPRGLPRALAVAACLAAAACASGGAGSGGAAPAARAPSTQADATGSAPAAEAATDAAASGYVDADVAFMRGMIRHHAQAIVMARLAPTHDASPGLRRLAARILNSQKAEISLMADWLRDRGEPVPDAAALAGDAADDAAMPGDGAAGTRDAGPGPLEGWDEGPRMPGLLSDVQMARLDAARGEAFDRRFLTYMIDHHDGAVAMVERLVRTPGAARGESVFELASGIRSDQSAEIDRMRRMLRERLLERGSRR